MIEATVTIGNLLTVGGFLISAAVTLAVLKSDLRNIRDRVGSLETAYKSLGTALTQIAVQDARMEGHNERLGEHHSRLERIERAANQRHNT